MTAAIHSLAVMPLNPAIGAVVTGIDASRAVTPRLKREVEAALTRHHVLFFENQSVDPVSQRRFAEAFGTLHVHPIYPHIPDVPEILILDTGAHNPPSADTWHTDVTFIETPPLGSVLAAKELPPNGGNTVWSSGIAAYEALSAPFRGFLQGLTAVHDFAKAFSKDRWGQGEDEAAWQSAVRKHPPVVHPVVRTHPVSGRKGLFVNEGFTTHIRELAAKESEAVLRLLFEQVAKPDFTIRWRWKAGDVAFWDNRLTQHYALADYLPHRRVMHRATIIGGRPV